MKNRFCWFFFLVFAHGCWDEGEPYRIPVNVSVDAGLDAGIPNEWSGFGSACEIDQDCRNYPVEEKRCIHSCVGLINTPNGYCTACCNEPGPDKCAPGIDCVGYSGIYLVCLAHCTSDEDCRQEDGYECRPIYYIPDEFPGNYCLPKEEFVEPEDTDVTIDESLCPWPWIS